MSVRFRPFAGERDYMALRSLIVQNYADPKRRFYPSLGDLLYSRLRGGGPSVPAKSNDLRAGGRHRHWRDLARVLSNFVLCHRKSTCLFGR